MATDTPRSHSAYLVISLDNSTDKKAYLKVAHLDRHGTEFELAFPGLVIAIGRVYLMTETGS